MRGKLDSSLHGSNIENWKGLFGLSCLVSGMIFPPGGKSVLSTSDTDSFTGFTVIFGQYRCDSFIESARERIRREKRLFLPRTVRSPSPFLSPSLSSAPLLPKARLQKSTSNHLPVRLATLYFMHKRHGRSPKKSSSSKVTFPHPVQGPPCQNLRQNMRNTATCTVQAPLQRITSSVQNIS